MYPQISLSSSYLNFFFLIGKLWQSLNITVTFAFAPGGAKLLYEIGFLLYFHIKK